MAIELSAGQMKLSFLWAATAFLLVLRFREVDSTFLAPPDAGAEPSKTFSFCEGILTKAQIMAATRRSRHSHAPAVVESALAFLRKSGGNPDIIKVIGSSLDSESE